MPEFNAKHFESTEKKLAKDLKQGRDIDAACILLDEVHKNPEEFRALVKRSMAMPDSANGVHLNVAKNGDVFVWDKTEHRGIYAGTDLSLAPKPDCPQPVANVAPPADAPPAPVAAADIPPAPAALPPTEIVDPTMADRRPAIPRDAVEEPRGFKGDARPPQATCAEEHDFKGLNLGLIRIGVYDHKSFGAGVNIGIAKGDGMIGGHTGAEARVGMADLGACAAAGVDIDERGLQPAVKGRLNVANIAGAGAEAGVVLGPNSSVNAGVEGEALGVHAKVKEKVTANDQGLGGSHAVEAGFLDLAGAHHHAHAELSEDSRVGTNVGAHIGPASIETGVGVETNRNTVIKPGAYLDFGDGPNHSTIHADAQIGPSADLRGELGVATTNDDHPENWQNNAIKTGIGVSGLGIKAVEETQNRTDRHSFGVGKDYAN